MQAPELHQRKGEGRRRKERKKITPCLHPPSLSPWPKEDAGRGGERGAAARVRASVRSKPTHTSTNYRTRALLNPPPAPAHETKDGGFAASGWRFRTAAVARRLFLVAAPKARAGPSSPKTLSLARGNSKYGSFGAPALLKLRPARIDAAAADATDASAASCTASYPRTSQFKFFSPPISGDLDRDKADGYENREQSRLCHGVCLACTRPRPVGHHHCTNAVARNPCPQPAVITCLAHSASIQKTAKDGSVPEPWYHTNMKQESKGLIKTITKMTPVNDACDRITSVMRARTRDMNAR